jgi:hypothetical protein
MLRCFEEVLVLGIMLVSILLTAQTGNAVLTGQIQTLEGGPAAAVRVSAMPVPTGNAIPADGPNYFNATPAVSTALSDNQGRYRLANVPPGRYYILAGLINEPTFYPASKNTNAEGATIVTVAPGAAMDNLNFKLLWALGRRVSGRMTLSGPPIKGQAATLSGSRVDDLLSAPLEANGAFEFGRVSPGTYLLSVFPPPPGLAGIVVRVADADITGLQIVPPPTHGVSGRIVSQNGGPVPRAILAFFTPQSYVGAPINPDGTFNLRLHAARHRADLAGMPVGYSIASVRLGSADASQGFDVRNADVSGIVITVAGPNPAPRVRGKISGLPVARLASTKVELTGPIVGALEAQVQPDGTFEFPTVVSGLYTLRLPQVPEFAPMNLAVVTRGVTEANVTVPSK